MITTEQLINIVVNDVDTLANSVNIKPVLLQSALATAIFKAINECAVTSKLTRSTDAFYDANKIYVAILDIYQTILADMLNIDYNFTDAEVQIVGEQTAVFIALLGKLLRTARSAETADELVHILPGALWIKHVKQVYDTPAEKSPDAI